MNRKHFLGNIAALVGGIAIPIKQSLAASGDEELVYKKPRYLQKGDSIGITAPAGWITQEEIQPAVQVMESWGYKIVTGDTIGK